MSESPNRAGPAGTALRASGKDGPQLIASSGKRWTDEAEARFLDSLAASCNLRDREGTGRYQARAGCAAAANDRLGPDLPDTSARAAVLRQNEKGRPLAAL